MFTLPFSASKSTLPLFELNEAFPLEDAENNELDLIEKSKVETKEKVVCEVILIPETLVTSKTVPARRKSPLVVVAVKESLLVIVVFLVEFIAKVESNCMVAASTE